MIQCENIYLTDDLEVQLMSFTHPFKESKPVNPTIASPKSPAIIIIPGGSYYHCAAHEATPVALHFQEAGYQCFTLHRYSVGTHSAFPRPMEDLGLAVAYIRLHAERWQIDPQKIIVMGFSAGGHMAASLGNYWARNELFTTYRYHDFSQTQATIQADPDILKWTDSQLRRPNAIILGYAYLNYSGMEGAFQKGLDPLLNKLPSFLKEKLKPSPEEKQSRGHTLAGRLNLKFSVWQKLLPLLHRLPSTKKARIGRALLDDHPLMCLDKTVCEQTPPTFLWWCDDDSLVPPQQSIEMKQALAAHHIPHCAINYPTGGHGLGIARENAHHSSTRIAAAENWSKEAVKWLSEQKMPPIF